MSQNKTRSSAGKRIDLFQKARANGRKLEKRFKAIKKKPGVLDFTNQVQTSARISINRHREPLLELLSEDEMPSGYHDAERKGYDTFEKYLRVNWGTGSRELLKFIRRRVAFYDAFKGGKDHLFGALNGGCAGAAAKNGAYGYYCIVLKNVDDPGQKIAYCMRDTLAEDAYWICENKETQNADCKNCPCNNAPTCQVNFETLLDAYAPHSHRGRLAALKSKDSIKMGLTSTEIGNLLIQRNSNATEEYIEVCFVLPVARKHIQEIRFHPGLVADLIDEALLDPKSLHQTVSAFRQFEDVRKELDGHNIKYLFGD